MAWGEQNTEAEGHAQLAINIGSADITLSDEVLKGIDEIHSQHPYPCP